MAWNLRQIQRTNGNDGFVQYPNIDAFAKQLRDGGYKKLLIPANLGETHWILFQVDFEANTLMWGM